MQIQNFNPINFNPINNIRKTPSSIILPNDSVSFGCNVEPKTEIMKKAENFGLNIYTLFQNGSDIKQAVQDEARKNIPNIQVKDVKELKKVFSKDMDTSRYVAYLLPSYGDDCKLKNATLYLRTNGTSIQKIGSAAHEYTHALQRTENDDYMGLAPLVNNNLYQARALNSFAAYVFSALEGNLKSTEIFDEAVRISETENKDLKTAFIEAGGFKDEKECKKAFKSLYMKCFNHVQDELSKNKDYASYMPFQNDPLRLKRTIRNSCKTRAEYEKEAYTVQRNVISAIDKDALTSDNKANPVLYELIAEALS